MKRPTLLLTVGALVFAAATAHAQSERATLSLRARFGVATAPFYTSNFPSVRGHALVTTVSGSYAIAARETIALVMPIALASIEQPAGAYVDELAWGNPTLLATHSESFEVTKGRTLRWFGGLRVSLPLAESGRADALLANRALAIANALDGWRDQASYAPGRLSLAPHAGITFDTRPWTFDAALTVPMLVKVSSADLPADARARAVGVASVVHAGATVQPASWLVAGVGADLVVNAVRPIVGARSTTSTTQLVLAPQLAFLLGQRARLTADFVAPIAGSLGGSTYSASLLLSTNW